MSAVDHVFSNVQEYPVPNALSTISVRLREFLGPMNTTRLRATSRVLYQRILDERPLVLSARKLRTLVARRSPFTNVAQWVGPIQHSFPEHVRSVTIREEAKPRATLLGCVQTLNLKNFRTLCLDANVVPTSVRTLTISSSMESPFSSSKDLPPNLDTLLVSSAMTMDCDEVPNSIRCLRGNVIFHTRIPPNLCELKIDMNTIMDFRRVRLPPTLRSLDAVFDQVPTSDLFPAHLKRLVMQINCPMNIDERTFPPKLEELEVFVSIMADPRTCHIHSRALIQNPLRALKVYTGTLRLDACSLPSTLERMYIYAFHWIEASEGEIFAGPKRPELFLTLDTHLEPKSSPFLAQWVRESFVFQRVSSFDNAHNFRNLRSLDVRFNCADPFGALPPALESLKVDEITLKPGLLPSSLRRLKACRVLHATHSETPIPASYLPPQLESIDVESMHIDVKDLPKHLKSLTIAYSGLQNESGVPFPGSLTKMRVSWFWFREGWIPTNVRSLTLFNVCIEEWVNAQVPFPPNLEHLGLWSTVRARPLWNLRRLPNSLRSIFINQKLRFRGTFEPLEVFYVVSPGGLSRGNLAWIKHHFPFANISELRSNNDSDLDKWL